MANSTIQEIAIEFGVPVHRVRYAVHACRIAPCRRIGNIRTFSAIQVTAIGAVLAAEKGFSTNSKA